MNRPPELFRSRAKARRLRQLRALELRKLADPRTADGRKLQAYQAIFRAVGLA